MKRFLIGLIGVVACCLGIWQSARIGFARNLAEQAVLTNATASADRAVRMLPNDAETHAAHGIILQRTERYAEACGELERAIQLRPDDYFLWMLLGVTRDLNGQQDTASQALRQSIVLAPTYAKPHWLLGNLLLRMRRTDEALDELRIAATSDQSLLPNVIDLVWGVSGHDVVETIRIIQPQTDTARLSLAIYFANQKQGPAAIEQFRSTQSLDGENVHKLMKVLMDTRLFVEAYEVWTKIHGAGAGVPSLINGGFEDDINLDQKGFGWRIAENTPNVTLSADPSQYQGGQKSLRIDFRGNSNPAVPLVTQLILTSPRTNYRLSFQTSSKEFMSPGRPVLVVHDASDEKDMLLAQSAALSGESGWRETTLDFTTGERTTAVRIGVVRQGCDNPCAAYGTAWLDSFVIKTTQSESASPEKKPTAK